MKIPIKYIIELGLIRKKDECANCGKKMDVKDYHIQLCKSCRKIELDKYYKKEIENNLDRISKYNRNFPKIKTYKNINELLKYLKKRKIRKNTLVCVDERDIIYKKL